MSSRATTRLLSWSASQKSAKATWWKGAVSTRHCGVRGGGGGGEGGEKLVRRTWQVRRFKCGKLKCFINIPNYTFWALALERKWDHTEKEKNLWTWWNSTPRPLEQITVALPTALQSQMPDSWSWELAANIYVSEGVSSKVWPLNTIRLLITAYIRWMLMRSEGVSSKVWPLNTIRLLITVYIRWMLMRSEGVSSKVWPLNTIRLLITVCIRWMLMRSEGVSSKVWPLNTIRLLITVYIRWMLMRSEGVSSKVWPLNTIRLLITAYIKWMLMRSFLEGCFIK